MDIRDLPHRHHARAAQGSKHSQPAAAKSDVASSESPEGSTAAEPGATTQQVSGGGRFMHFLQAFEDKHPEEAKRILNGIADKLRADAEHAGPWSERLERWADKVQKAADTGDMSNLLPAWQPHAHFGVRAYQKAQAAPEAEAGALEQVASSMPAPAAASSSTDAAAASSTPSVTTPIIAATPAATGSSTDAAATSSSPSVTTPIITATPAATGSSTDAAAASSSPSVATPIIAGTPAATGSSRTSA